MNVSIGNLARGQWRFLTQSEMDEINRSIEQSSKTQECSEDPNKQPSFKHKSKAGAAHHAKGYNRDGKSLPTNKPKSPSKKRLTGTLKFKK
jgi:23S rRNA pseudouridine2604 synthase